MKTWFLVITIVGMGSIEVVDLTRSECTHANARMQSAIVRTSGGVQPFRMIASFQCRQVPR